MKRISMILFAAALLLRGGAAAPGRGVPVIFETDMGNDIDDALALDLLSRVWTPAISV